MPMLRQNIEEIEALAAKLKQEREETVSGLLTRLHDISQELELAWDGPSRLAFHESYGDWIHQLEKFGDTLKNVNQYLTSVVTNFRDLDAAAESAAQGASATQ